jgi:Rv2525c-like, glycoside hydrolase-like domain
VSSSLRCFLGCVLLAAFAAPSLAQSAYLGFDRNDYPGDQNLPALRKTFSFAGYWLNNPPGEKHNSWAGKRLALKSAGFGFLVLFNGRLYSELHDASSGTSLGQSDARAAAAAARREGFSPNTILFLDQEEGGRMLPEQKAYIFAWVDGVTAAGFRTGIYCSGIAAKESSGESIVTARDIRESAVNRKITYFVTNDACPPSPGCAFPRHPPQPSESGTPFASLWQFAQSPKRRDVAAGCSNYTPDHQCYPPGTDPSQHLHVDLETAASPDPSEGR